MISCIGFPSVSQRTGTPPILPTRGNRRNYLRGNAITTKSGYAQATMDQHAGHLLREWRQRRRLSQLDLAIAANVSSRHLSFVETGRSRPTSEMILHLAEHLEVPLRDRNALLLAGGYAPAYAERGLAEPELSAVRQALKRVLAGQRRAATPG